MNDIFIVNAYVLFREYQKIHLELESIKRSKNDFLIDFHEKLIRSIMEFDEYPDTPFYCTVKKTSIFRLITFLDFLM